MITVLSSYVRGAQHIARDRFDMTLLQIPYSAVQDSGDNRCLFNIIYKIYLFVE